MGAGLVLANQHGDFWFGYRGGHGWLLGESPVIFGRNVKSVGLRLWQNVVALSHQRTSHVSIYASPVGGEGV